MDSNALEKSTNNIVASSFVFLSYTSEAMGSSMVGVKADEPNDTIIREGNLLTVSDGGSYSVEVA